MTLPRFLKVAGLGIGLAGAAFVWGFALRPLFDRWASAQQEEPETSGQLWTCGMHPQVIQPKPGSCPICGMKLTPLVATPGAQDAVLSIDPVVVQNMGLRVVSVSEGPLVRTVRLVGWLREAQPSQRDVTLRASGFVERLYADTEGMAIRQGDPLFELYSPELLVAQEELIAARKMRAALAADTLPDIGRETDDLIATARQKLVLLGVDEAEIAEVERLPRAKPRLTFRSPINGTLMRKEIVQGTAVAASTTVLRITDLTRLWLDAQAYESDIRLLGLGQKGRARVAAFPGEAFEGEVFFVAPDVGEDTRTATVRLAMPNADMRLRPGMYARVEFDVTVVPNALQVPVEAVLDTGTRQLAFVSLGDGKFEPREVRKGAYGEGGVVEILDGLRKDESVVVSGQFLLDSESRLREAIHKMLAEKLVSKTPAAGKGEKGEPGRRTADLDSETRARIATLLVPYLALADALARDRLDDSALDALRRAADDLTRNPKPEITAEVAKLASSLAALAEPGDLDARRKKFAPLSDAIVELATLAPPADKLWVLRCSMAEASWLQKDAEVRNPFYGSGMLRCGDVVRTLP